MCNSCAIFLPPCLKYGTLYEGQLLQGKYHGKGRFLLPGGAGYSGDYVEGEKHGRGRYAWPDGTSYFGEYQHDRRHGKGKMFAPPHPLGVGGPPRCIDDGYWRHAKEVRADYAGGQPPA